MSKNAAKFMQYSFVRDARLPIIVSSSNNYAHLMPVVAELLSQSDSAEVNALAHGDGKEFLLAADFQSAMLVARHRNVITAISAPFGDKQGRADLLKEFSRAAKIISCKPVIYKATPDLIPDMEQAGFRYKKIGEEAIVDVPSYDKVGKSFANLRRKLNKAEKSGTTIKYFAAGEAVEKFESLSVIDKKWQSMNGKPLSFSQGLLSEEYLGNNDVFVAYVDDEPVAFVTMWKDGAGHENSIDIMRQDYDAAPDGTMYLLVDAAIEHSKTMGAKKFSLCNVMFKGLDDENMSKLAPVFKIANDRLPTFKRLQNLAQFKNAFNPDWQNVLIGSTGRLPPVRPALSLWRLTRGAKTKPCFNNCGHHEPGM